MYAELDLFSGRPNPRWELTAEEGRELRARLSALPEARQGAILETLGYRGIVVTAPNGTGAGLLRITISAGVVLVEKPDGTRQYFVDRGRALERWVFETSRGRVDPEVYSAVEQQVR
jgi:hypothetical protein